MSIVLFGKTPAQRAIALIRGQFAAGQAGLWWESSPFSSLFQDSAGTTPVTAVEQPIGKDVDKSGRGNHGLQATAGARPTLSARVNLLTKTEDFSDAAWTSTLLTLTPGQTDPNGGTLACRITATGVDQQIYQANSVTTGSALLVYGLYIRRVTGTGAIRLYNTDGATYTDITASLTSAWQRFTSTPAAANVETTAFGNVMLTTSGDAIEIAFPHKEVGSVATRYQRVNTASDYDAAGFPQFLKFDGTDDGLATAAFAAGTLTSNMDCFIAVKRNSSVKGILADVDATHFFGAFDSAGTATASTLVGASSTYLADGVAVPGGTGTTQVQLNTALTVGSWHLVEVHNLDLSAWTAFQISLLTGYFLNGNIQNIILLPAQSDANRAVIRKYLGSKVGLVL